MEASVVERWKEDFEGLLSRVGPCFGRHDLRKRAGGNVRGLLGRVERKNGWQLAEPEVRRLMLAIAWPALTDLERAIAWSDWRRRHQAKARQCHYRGRGAAP